MTGNNNAGNELFVANLIAGDHVEISYTSGTINFDTTNPTGPECIKVVAADGLARAIFDDPSNQFLCYYDQEHTCSDPMASSAHAGLYIKRGSTRTFIGDNPTSINETLSETLSLGVNDCKNVNDSGQFNVSVTITHPALSINDATLTEGDTGSANATFTVSALPTPAPGQTVTVNYATANSSATAGADYTSKTGTLTLNNTTTSATITVPILGDTLDEANETFFVNLSGAVNATVTDGQGLGTINDNDPLPSITIADVSLTEGDTGSANMTFTATLSPASGRSVTVNYATANGTATAADYTSKSGTLTFAAGATSQTFTVPILGDALDEDNETILVNLSAATNANITDTQATGTITDNDALPSFSIADASVTEGDTGSVNMTFTLTLSPVSGRATSVNYTTANGTATSTADYTANSTRLTINAGATSQTFTVPILADLLDEDNEYFLINLSGATNATIADTQAIGTINDNDPLPTLTIADVSLTEGDSGSQNMTFTILLSPASGRTVQIGYATANGTATSADYTPQSGLPLLYAGATTHIVTIPVLGDLLDENNETILINFSNVFNANLPDAQAVGTITDNDPLPSITIADASLTEGDAGSANMTFTATLSPASGRSVTVNYATANGTATAADYTSKSGTLTFAAGATTQTFTVPILGDALDEPDETFLVNLSAATNANITDTQATGTITDNDPLPSLTIANASLTEGDTGSSNMTFTVSLFPASGRSITVNYATANGTATATDYTSNSATLTLNAGATSQTFTVPILGDLLDEDNETFLVNLSAASNATITDAQATATITDNDPLPSLTIANASLTEGDAGSQNMTFTVSLSPMSGRSVTVYYATADSSASSADYYAAAGTLTFSPSITSQTFTVLILGDTLDEADESFVVNLSAPSNATLTDAQATGTITDNDPLPSLSIANASLAEGDTGSASMTFTVSLSPASGRAVSVDYATANGTASSADYTAVLGTLDFAAGATSRTVTVPVLGDTLDEDNETFLVNLSGASNASITDAQATGTITDDDPLPSLSIADASIAEGDAGSKNLSFTVSLSPASGRSVSVNYATADGTASSADYTAALGKLDFAPGATSQTVTVPVLGDTLDEDNETFLVNLSGASNASIADAQATGTITDDDPLPSLTIADAGITEGDTASQSLTFTVSLSPASGRTVSVSYATANGTATSADYTAKSGTLSFAAGATSQTFTVPILGDTLDEDNETFLVNLTDASNAALSDAQAVATITDNDPEPSLAFEAAASSRLESAGAITVTAELSAASAKPISVQVGPSGGTASTADYSLSSVTLSFEPGVLRQSATVTLVDDALDEDNETLILELSSPVNATLGAQTSHTLNIQDNDAAPTVAFAGATSSGAEFVAAPVIAVRLDAPSGKQVSVAYSVAGTSTATQGTDFQVTGANLVFAPGTTEALLPVEVLQDSLDESNETIELRLAAPNNATLGLNSTIYQILDDDGAPLIAFELSQSSASEGAGSAGLVVKLAPASPQQITVAYAVTGGSATGGGVDYTLASGTLVFPPNATEKSISVALLQDSIYEPAETVEVTLSNAVNADLGTPLLHTLTLTESSPAPSLQWNASASSQSEAAGAVSVTATLSGARSEAISVPLTVGGSAGDPGDYHLASAMLQIPALALSGSVSLSLADDSVGEQDETITLELDTAGGVPIGTRALHTLSILDNDGLPGLAVPDMTAVRGTDSGLSAVFTIRMSAPSLEAVSVHYTTVDGTARAGVDYQAVSGTAPLAAGQTEAQVGVALLGGALPSGSSRNFLLRLSAPVNAGVSDAEGVCTLVAPEQAPGLSVQDTTVAAGATANFTVRLSTPSGQVVGIEYETADGTALAGVDYEAKSGSLVFMQGETEKTVGVPILGARGRASKNFYLRLSQPDLANVTDGEAQALIQGENTLSLAQNFALLLPLLLLARKKTKARSAQ